MHFITVSSNMRTRAHSSITLFTAAIFFILAVSFVAAAAPDRPFGDVKILATVSTPPGFPEGIAVNGDRVYVAGPASFDTAGTPASKVLAYDAKTGALIRTYEIQGEFTQFPHANSCIAFDGEGRLYVVNLQLGIVRIDLGSGAQEIYAAPLPFTKQGAMVVTNHAFATMIPANFTVLDVFVDDKEFPLVRPNVP